MNEDSADMTDPLDPRQLRAVLGRFTTGVTVMTTMTPDGPVGMTVNSFSSVSLDPPLVLFCVSRRSCLRQSFVTARVFAVNVLHQGQQEISRRFATPGFDRFGSIQPRVSRRGAPLLDGALAVIECTREQVVPTGDHEIVIGRVEAMAAAPVDMDRPLVFFGGAYRSLNNQRQQAPEPHTTIPGVLRPRERG